MADKEEQGLPAAKPKKNVEPVIKEGDEIVEQDGREASLDQRGDKYIDHGSESDNEDINDGKPPAAATAGGGRFITQFLGSLHHFASGGFGGLCMEFTSVAFPSFLDDPRAFQISLASIGLIVGFFYLGTIIGFFCGSIVAHRYSKRRFLLISYIPMAISWIPFMFVTNVPLMVAARVLQGIIFGACSNVSFAYVLEITDAHSRNWALSLWALAVGVGAVGLAVFGSLLRWDHLAMVSAVFTAAFFPMTCRMPDTPIYWLRKKSDAKARKSLTTYRKDTHDVDRELTELKTYLDIADEGFTWKRIHQKKYAWPLAKTLIFNIFKPWTGYAILIGYTVDLFDRSHISGPITPHTANIIAQVVDFLAQFGSTFVVSLVSRKMQMGVGSLCMGLIQTLNGIYIYAVSKDQESHGTMAYHQVLSNLSTWWPIFGISAWFAVNSLGLANAMHLFMSETLPQKVSSFGMALCFVCLTLNQFMVSTFYFQLLNAVGLHGVFWIMAGTAYFLAACSFVLVGDTRNKTLLELEQQHHQGETAPNSSKGPSQGQAL